MSHPKSTARSSLRRPLALVGSFALAIVGSFSVLASPASAHTPSVSSSCTTLTVNLTSYNAPKPATAAVTHTEWKWSLASNANNKPNDPNGIAGSWTGSSHNWTFTTTNTYTAAPSGGFVKINASAVTVTDTPAVPANATPNHVKVTIAGDVKDDADFGTTFSKTYTYADKYAANAYVVDVDAWDNNTYDAHVTGKSAPCPDGVPTSHKVTLCHATDSNTNPYNVITVDDDAVFKQGHDGHDGPVWNAGLKASHIKWGDIIPAFNYEVVENHVVVTKHYDGKNLPAGQSILDAGCSTTPQPVTPVAPTVTQPTCDGTTNMSGSFTLPTTEGITYTKDGNVVTATADEGYTLKAAANGWVGSTSSQTFTVSYDGTPDCTIHVSGKVTTVPEACTGERTHGDGAIVVTAVDGIEYHLGSADGELLTGSTPEAAGTYTVYEVASDTKHTVDTVTVTVSIESAGACHTPTPNPGAYAWVECPKSAIAFHLSNLGDAAASLDVYVDGELNRTVNLDGEDDTYFEVFNLDENSTHHVKVTFGEYTLLDEDFTVDCLAVVVPVLPTFTETYCNEDHQGVPATIVLPTTEGITYTVDGDVVTATANDGYELGDARDSGYQGNHYQQSVTVTFPTAATCVTPPPTTEPPCTCTEPPTTTPPVTEPPCDCTSTPPPSTTPPVTIPPTTPPVTVPPTTIPPSTTPPVTTPPTTTPPTTTPPATTPPVVTPPSTTPPATVPPVTPPRGTTPPPAGLPFTGSNTGAIVGIGMLALLAGAALIIAARVTRRRGRTTA